MEELIEQIRAQTSLDVLTTVTGLVYVLLAARNNPWCWVFGAISCATWAYVDITQYDLYSDAGLQLFYVAMSFVGIYQWQFGSSDKGELPISRMTIKEHLWYVSLALIAGLLLGHFVSEYFAAAATYWDAITTTFSVGATVFLLRRKLENWLYWIGIDLVYIGIFWSRGAFFFALLMLVYTIVAAYGYRSWLNIIKNDSK